MNVVILLDTYKISSFIKPGFFFLTDITLLHYLLLIINITYTFSLHLQNAIRLKKILRTFKNLILITSYF